MAQRSSHGPTGRVERAHRGSSAGFTLVEVLVSLVILATVAVALQRAASSTVNTILRAEDRTVAARVAASLLATHLTAADSTGDRFSGTVDGRRWSARLSPLPALIPTKDGPPPDPPDDPNAAAWVPMRLVVEVEMLGEAALRIETVELVREAR